MPSAKLRFSDGLHSSPGDAGPNHLVGLTVNFLLDQGRVEKRNGAVPIFAADGAATVPYVGWGLGVTTTPDYPVATRRAAIAFDSVNGHTYIFGGYNGSSEIDTFWRYDGTGFTQLTMSRPSARYGAMMTFDSARNKLVLVGGTHGGGTYAETYEFDIATQTWSAELAGAITNPGGVSDGAMAFDPVRNVCILVGGLVGAFGTYQVWTWNGSIWVTYNPVTHPSERVGNSLAWDTTTGTMILFGGYNPSGAVYNAETWQLDCAAMTWSNRTGFLAAAPAIRAHMGFCTDPATGRPVLFGGYDGAGNYSAQTWRFATTTWTNLAPTVSPAARGFTVMAPTTSSRLLMVGGYNGSGMSDAHSYISNTWTQLPGAITASSAVTVGGASSTVEAVPYVGAASPFTRTKIYGRTGVCAKPATLMSSIYGEVWTGSAWTRVEVRTVRRPQRDVTNALTQKAFFIGSDGASAGLYMSGYVLDCIFDPPSNWATKAIGGQTLYWFRLRGMNGADVNGAQMTSGGSPASHVQCTENRILHIKTWIGRNGASHTFIVFLSGEDGKTLKYVLDGTVLSQSSDLQPDGSARVFSKNTRVWSAYSDATDRLIGYVSGRGWFFLIPGNGEIYHLEAGDGVDTEFQTVDEGLRGALPDGQVQCYHHDRLFQAKGQRIMWSGQGVFQGIWPNANEVDLADDGGPIVALASVAGMLVAFKRDSTWVLQEEGANPEVFTTDRLQGGLGCIASGSVAVRDRYVFRLTESGLAVFDGNNDQLVGDEAMRGFFTSDFSADPSLCQAIYASAWDQYRLFFMSPRSDVLDSALYVDLADPANPTFWLQGRYESSDHSFDATAIAHDSTGKQNRTLYGDTNGVVWEADRTYRDGPSVVKAQMLSPPIGAQGAGTRILKRATTALRNVGRHAFSVLARFESSGKNEKAVAQTPYKVAVAGETFSTSTTFGSNTFGDPEQIKVRETPFGVRNRQMQIGYRSTVEGGLSVISTQVDAATAGDKREGS